MNPQRATFFAIYAVLTIGWIALVLIGSFAVLFDRGLTGHLNLDLLVPFVVIVLVFAGLLAFVLRSFLKNGAS